jgi:hypothetical protein
MAPLEGKQKLMQAKLNMPINGKYQYSEPP